MILDGFAVACYRSFGKEVQKFAPLKKINLIIGQNNSGKSNVLRLLKNHYSTYLDTISRRSIGKEQSFSDLDNHQGEECRNVILGVAVNVLSDKFQKKIETSQEGIKHYFKRLIDSSLVKDDNNLLWIISNANRGAKGIEFTNEYVEEIINSNILTEAEWRGVCLDLNQSASDIRSNIKNVFVSIFMEIMNIPLIYHIPAIRSVNTADSSPDDFSGNGLIQKIAKLQNPDHDEQKLKRKFENINLFLRTVLDNDDATIEIPYVRDKIIVNMDNKSLPLESLGTGIHEVIILAAASTIINDSVICIEEPELHLHPLLQKKLIHYLAEHTSNQYFISTHSSHLLDYKSASIFHIQHDHKTSLIELSTTNDKLFEICSDLGYKPSDLLQTNCIIWVEGPSDRIYLNYWIKSLDNDLIEGTHYSIMFYGGRLLSHLTMDEKEVDDFISLKKMNRNLAIIIDSDRTSSSKRINKTKQRIKKEFTDSDSMVWITNGREMENYIEPDLYEKSLLKVHQDGKRIENKSIYSHLPIYQKKGKRGVFVANKIKVAKEVINNPTDFDILDLNTKLSELIRFIKKSNGIET